MNRASTAQPLALYRRNELRTSHRARPAVFLDRDGVINSMVYHCDHGLVDSPRIPAEAYGYLPELARRYPQKPIYVSFTGDHQAYAQAREYLEERSIPVFYPLEDIFEVLHVLCYCREQFDREG
jgi:hypothetical protein